VHVGLFHLDITKLHRRIALDEAVGRGLPHDLGVDDGVLGYVDDEVSEDLGGAGEPASVRNAADLLVAFLLRPLFRKVVQRGDDLVLGEVAFLDRDLAAPAGGTPAADAFHIDAELARRVEHRSSDWEPAALAGRHEENERILLRRFGHVGLVL
jgi:hypothetical protein